MRHLPHPDIQKLTLLCSGFALLLALAVFVGGSPVAVTQSALSAAVWESATTSVSGYPLAHTCYKGTPGSPRCNPNPSPYLVQPQGTAGIFAAYPTANTSQLFYRYAYPFASSTPTNTGTVPTAFWHWARGTMGTPLTVTAGTPVTLEWSCQDYVDAVAPLSCTNYDVFNNCIGSSNYAYRYLFFTNAVGTGFSTGSGSPRKGTATVTPLTTTTYLLTCNVPGYPSDNSGWAMGSGMWIEKLYLNVTVTVAAALPNPTLTIVGNGANPATVEVGKPITIVGTYTAGAGDTLTKTALNDFQNNALAGVAWTPPTSKNYVFTPSAVGSYMFYPAVQTNSYPSWNNYGQSLVVTAVPPCAGGQTNPPTCNVCASGYHISGASCVADACPGPNQVNYPTCSCAAGYVLQGGACVAGTCAGVHQINYPTCSCDVGYSMQGGVCVAQTEAINPPGLVATPARVVKGQQTHLSWSTTGMPNGACVVKNQSGITISTALTASNLPVTVTSASRFTLLCTPPSGALTSSATVQVVPSFKEL